MALTIKKGRNVLPGARDPYPFPNTIETPFQTKARRAYTQLRTNNMCSFAQSVNLTGIYSHIINIKTSFTSGASYH